MFWLSLLDVLDLASLQVQVDVWLITGHFPKKKKTINLSCMYNLFILVWHGSASTSWGGLGVFQGKAWCALSIERTWKWRSQNTSVCDHYHFGVLNILNQNRKQTISLNLLHIANLHPSICQEATELRAATIAFPSEEPTAVRPATAFLVIATANHLV